MQARRWIYKRYGSRHWIAFEDKIRAGYLENRERLYLDPQGNEKVSIQVRVTPKSLLKLAELLEQPLN